MNADARHWTRLGREAAALVVLGLLAASVLLDMVDSATGTGAFTVASYRTLGTGLLCSLVLIPLDALDWLSCADDVNAGKIAAASVLGHAGCVALFAASWWMRAPESEVPGLALWLALGGGALAVLTSCVVSALQRNSEDDAQPLDIARAAPPLRTH